MDGLGGCRSTPTPLVTMPSSPTRPCGRHRGRAATAARSARASRSRARRRRERSRSSIAAPRTRPVTAITAVKLEHHEVPLRGASASPRMVRRAVDRAPDGEHGDQERHRLRCRAAPGAERRYDDEREHRVVVERIDGERRVLMGQEDRARTARRGAASTPSAAASRLRHPCGSHRLRREPDEAAWVPRLGRRRGRRRPTTSTIADRRRPTAAALPAKRRATTPIVAAEGRAWPRRRGWRARAHRWGGERAADARRCSIRSRAPPHRLERVAGRDREGPCRPAADARPGWRQKAPDRDRRAGSDAARGARLPRARCRSAARRGRHLHGNRRQRQADLGSRRVHCGRRRRRRGRCARCLPGARGAGRFGRHGATR